MSRYDAMFARLAEKSEGAFIPFAMLGDPSLERSAEILDLLIANGADALEVGLPFSDPVADGLVIQAAGMRALAAGVTVSDCFALLADLRRRHPEVPIGILTYANLVLGPGPERFMKQAAKAGVDSVLVADVPCLEAERVAPAADYTGIDWVCVLPPDASDQTVDDVARWGRGYTYVQGRAGVTGSDRAVVRPSSDLLARLRAAGGPPPVVGFGISTPQHVRMALDAGAVGAISGSAVVQRIADGDLDGVAQFIVEMKSATRNV